MNNPFTNEKGESLVSVVEVNKPLAWVIQELQYQDKTPAHCRILKDDQVFSTLCVPLNAKSSTRCLIMLVQAFEPGALPGWEDAPILNLAESD